MADDALIAYCRAREALRAEMKRSKEDTLEKRDAEKTIGGLLVKQMKNQDVQCVALERSEGVKYLHVKPGRRGSAKLKDESDVVSLVENISEMITHAEKKDIPKAVVDVVKQRLRERAPPAGPARVVEVSRAPRGVPISEVPMISESVGTLASQYVEAKTDLCVVREKMKPLRLEQKRTEEALIPLLPQHGMEIRISDGGKTKDVRIQPKVQQVKESNASTLYSIRSVIDMVRDAAEEAASARDEPLKNFDTLLKNSVLKRIELVKKQTGPKIQRDKIQVTKLLRKTTE